MLAGERQTCEPGAARDRLAGRDARAVLDRRDEQCEVDAAEVHRIVQYYRAIAERDRRDRERRFNR